MFGLCMMVVCTQPHSKTCLLPCMNLGCLPRLVAKRLLHGKCSGYCAGCSHLILSAAISSFICCLNLHCLGTKQSLRQC